MTHILMAWLLLTALVVVGETVEGYAKKVSSLIAPEKLATLGERGANPRVQKYVYWLATAQAQGTSPKAVAQAAVVAAGYTNKQARKLTVDAMVRNLEIASKLGCLDKEGIDDLRRGQAPTVRKGPYKGDQLSVDHIIPRAVVPELDKVIANLELMPLRMNEGKSASVGARQKSLAKKLRKAGLLTRVGLQALQQVR